MVAFAFEDFVFDDARRVLMRSGTVVKADGVMLDLLAVLVRNHDRIVSKQELTRALWRGRAPRDSALSVCVSRLRRKLGGDAKCFIINAYGRGYRFRPLVTVQRMASNALSPASLPARGYRGDEQMVGRGAIVDRILAALRPVRSGRGVMIALVGEAGIGKTRLTDALAAWAPELGFQLASGQCLPCATVPPLWPVRQIVRTMGAGLPLDSTPGGDHPATGFSAPIATDATWRQTKLTVTDALKNACRTAHRMVVLEDLHWADAATLEMLSHWMSELEQMSVAVVVSLRDNQQPLDRRCKRLLDRLIGHRDCIRIPLMPLLRPHIETYIESLFGSADPSLTDAVYEKSSGIPFFMVELLRPFVHGRAPSPAQLALPEPALESVKHTLRLLPSTTRNVLAASAVIGRSFDVALLARALERGASELIEELSTAQAHHLVVRVFGDSNSHLRFRSEPIRDTVYDGLPLLARAQLHLKVGEALCLRAMIDPESAVERALHLIAALPLGASSLAAAAARDAARASANLGAYADACRLLGSAVTALRGCPDVSTRLMSSLIEDIAEFGRAAADPRTSPVLDQQFAVVRRDDTADSLRAVGDTLAE